MGRHGAILKSGQALVAALWSERRRTGTDANHATPNATFTQRTQPAYLAAAVRTA
jgi:hypothetical protein